MSDIFAAAAHSLAVLLSTTDLMAGFILGTVTIAAFLFGFLVAFMIVDVEISAGIIVMLVAIPTAVVVVVQWWPSWAALFILIVATSIFVFGRHGGE